MNNFNSEEHSIDNDDIDLMDIIESDDATNYPDIEAMEADQHQVPAIIDDAGDRPVREFREFIPAEEIARADVLHPYRINQGWLEFGEQGEEEGEANWFRVCTAIWVVAFVRTQDSKGWGYVVLFRDPDGTIKELTIKSADLAGRDSSAVISALMDDGLRLAPGSKSKFRLMEYLTSAEPESRHLLVETTGWHSQEVNQNGQRNRVFLLGNRAIGNTNGQIVRLAPGAMTNSLLTQGGDYEAWKKFMAMMPGNSRLALAVSAGFAGPLMGFIKEESGGYHFYGASSTGKSTTLYCAGSIWGGGGANDGATGFVRQWRATANAMENLLLLHNDLMIAMDELGELKGADTAQVAYLVTNGQGKARMQANGAPQASKTYRCILLSSGEMTIVRKILEAKTVMVRAGMEVRIIDIPADAGCGMGVFENIHGFASPAEFSEHLKRMATQHYGWAGREYIESIIDREAECVEYYKYICQRFMDDNMVQDMDGQVRRVANRFALTATAGLIATELGILPWPEDEAYRSACVCFQAWLAQRGGTNAGEEIRGVEQVVRLLQLDGEQRFVSWDDGPNGHQSVEEAKSRMLGWRKLEKGYNWTFYAHASGFAELISGFNRNQIVSALIAKGILKPGENGEPTVRERIPHHGQQRIYRLTIAEYDAGQGVC